MPTYRKLFRLIQVTVALLMFLHSATPAIAMAIPQDAETNSAALSEEEMDISTSLQIGTEEFFAPQEPVANFKESQPPMEEILSPYLKLSAEPQLLIGKQPITLSWELSDVKETDYEIQLTLPEGLSLKEKELSAEAEKESNAPITIAKNESSGSVELQAKDLEKAPFYVILSVVRKGENILENAIILNEPLHGNIGKEKSSEKVSIDERVKMIIPPGFAKNDFALDFRYPGPNVGLSYSLSGFPVEILAVDTNNFKNLTKFDKEFTLQITYDEDQIFDWQEEAISLFYFDEEYRGWFPIDTVVDTEANTLTAKVDHLTAFDYGLSTWDSTMAPTIDAAQMSQFSGSASYNINFWTPQGPGGTQPSLSLNYSSAVIDNSSPFAQVSWVGAGWSLDTGYIKRNQHETPEKDDDTFSLVLNGVSELLLPINIDDQLMPNKVVTTYTTTSEQYYSIKSIQNEDDDPYQWTVKDKTGTTYTLNKKAETDFDNSCMPLGTGGGDDTWQWSLGSVTDKFGNTYVYNYTEYLKPDGGCSNKIAMLPDEIIYPNEKYKITFVKEDRTDYQAIWFHPQSELLVTQKRLAEIIIQHNIGGSGELVDWQDIRKYQFTYASSREGAVFPAIRWDNFSETDGITNTLIGVQELAPADNPNDPDVALPATTFTYEDNLHLTEVDNGQNGIIEFTYEAWKYEGEDTNEENEIVYKYGDGNEGCIDTNPRWEEDEPTVRCNIDKRLEVLGSGVGYKAMPSELIRLGSYIEIELDAWKHYTFNDPRDIFVGLRYHGFDEAEMAISWYEQNIGTDISLDDPDIRNVIRIPAVADVYQFDGFLLRSSAAVIREYFAKLLPTYYRVTERKITDMLTGTMHTYSYSYDGGALNDSVVSDFVATALIEDENGENTLDKLYTPISTEYRGNTMVRETYTEYGEANPSPRVTTSWFHQNDILSGNLYRTFVAEEDFYDPMTSFNSEDWVGGGTPEINYVAGDTALNITNETSTWNTTLSRNDGYSLSNGNYVYFQLMQSEAPVEAQYFVISQSGERFGIHTYGGNGEVKLQIYVGGSFYYASLAPTGFIESDHPYMAMLFLDDQDDFHARIWDVYNPSEYYEISASDAGAGANPFTNGQSWSFRMQVKNGSAWLDSYSEGKPFAETINEFEYITLYDSIGEGTIANIEAPSLVWDDTDPQNPDEKGYTDLQVNFTKLVNSISRQFEGDYSWNGVMTEYAYDSYGNVIETVEYAGSSTNPDFDLQSYRKTIAEYVTVSNWTSHLVGLPKKQQVYACNEFIDEGDEICPVGDNHVEMMNAVYYYYDSGKTQTPANGYLSRMRTWVDGTSYVQVEYNYDGFGNPTSTTQYDDYGTATSNPPQGSEITPSIVTTYDTTYNTYPITVTYNTLSGSPTITTEYDYALGLPISANDLNGNIAYAEYDGFGRQTKIIAPGDSSGSPTLQIQYIDAITTTGSETPYQINLQQKVDGSTAIRASRFYNGFGQMIQTQQVGALVDGAINTIVVNNTFDMFGNVLTQSVPYAVTNYATPFYRFPQLWQASTIENEYDIFGRIVSSQPANNNETVYSYADLSVTVTDPNGNDTTTTTDIWGNVIEVDEITGPDVSYTYDVLGQLTDASRAGNTTSITYDRLGRKLAMTDPDMGDWTYQYDALGNLTQQTDARGCITNLAYDDLNRLTGKTYSGTCAITTSSSTYTYDQGTNGLGLRTSMSDGSGSTTWAYDVRGRLIQEEKTITGYASTFTTEYAYNSADMVTSMTYPDGEVVSNTYSAGGLLTDIESDHYTDYIYLSGVTYDEAGRLLNLDFGDNNQADPNWSSLVTQTFEYHLWTNDYRGGFLARNSVETASSNVQMNLQYNNYDRNGNITKIIDWKYDEVIHLTYDSLNRLTTMLVEEEGTLDDLYYEAFTYDAATGNMDTKQMVLEPTAATTPTPVALTYDATHPHAVGAYDGNTYSYDANGNQTGREVDGISYELSYDHENRLVSVTGPTAMPTATLPTATLTGTPPTATLTGTPPTMTPSPSTTPSSTPETPTLTPTASNTPEPATDTPVPTETETLAPTPTATGTPPTATATMETSGTPTEVSEPEGDPPTETPTQTGTLPTLTHTSTGTPPTETPSETPVPETNTPTATLPATATATEETPPVTLTPSATPVESQTATLAPTSTGTSTLTATLTPTIQATDTPVPLMGVQSTGPVENASFIYDGDGNMVKSIIDGVTTYYVGGHYEIRDDGALQTELKYYTGPTGRFAMRVDDTLFWIFSDHLQSSSVILEEDGTLYSRTSYTAFGEVRCESGTSPTDYQYTGQRSYLDGFGLHYYVARWYDPATAHFAQADSIIPQPGNSGDWDRYAYVNYNPVNFSDPTGHYRIYYPEWDPSYGQHQKLNTCGVVAAAVALSMLRGEFVDYTDLLYLGYSQTTWEIHETVTTVPCVWTGIDVYCSSPIIENIDYYGVGVSGTLQAMNLNAMSDVRATVTQGTRQDLIDNVNNGLLTMVVFALPVDSGAGHWLTVIGYDSSLDELLFHDSNYGGERTESDIVADYGTPHGYSTFEEMWEQSNIFIDNNRMVTIERKENYFWLRGVDKRGLVVPSPSVNMR